METYYGRVRTPADAIILLEACRIGLLPRVQRRRSEKEQQSIRSGSVFVWNEREAGMRRWTDGKSWSASRVSGSFLTYREMESKHGGGNVSQSSVSRAGKTPETTPENDEEFSDGADERPDRYRYKPDDLMKQSFSITTSTGQHLHLISYYSRSEPSAANLQQPTIDPVLRQVRPQKGLYPESTSDGQQNLPMAMRRSMPEQQHVTTLLAICLCMCAELMRPPTWLIRMLCLQLRWRPLLSLFLRMVLIPTLSLSLRLQMGCCVLQALPHMITSNIKFLLTPRFILIFVLFLRIRTTCHMSGHAQIRF